MAATPKVVLEHECNVCAQMIQVTMPIRTNRDIREAEQMLRSAVVAHAEIRCFARPDDETD